MASNRWVRYRAAAYLRGRGFSFGVNDIFPSQAQALGKYCVNCDDTKAPSVAVCDGGFAVLTPASFDYAFLGPKIHAHPRAAELVEEAAKRIKPEGHLLIHLRNPETDPRQWLERWGRWQTKMDMVRDGMRMGVYKRLTGRKEILPIPEPPRGPRGRACIARYGAIGDAVQFTPLVRALAQDGYHVTLNMTEYAAPVFEQNPHVGNFIIQERDVIPNAELGEYWKEWEPEYDRYINLSESVEGTLLKVEGRRDFYTSAGWRRNRCNVNYSEHTMALGGYPDHQHHRGELYFSDRERRDRDQFRRELRDKFLILWGLNGTSAHKLYGPMRPLLEEWLPHNPDALVITLGDSRAQDLEFQHPQVWEGAGEFSLRQVMALTEVANLVVGPESALTNFSSCFSTPKIPLLSHSTHENLCKHWENDYCLSPNPALAPCYPCHQLHYTPESCPQKELIQVTPVGEEQVVMRAPACAMGAIEPEVLAQRMDLVRQQHPQH